MKKKGIHFLLCLTFLFLICFPRAARDGAHAGLVLWANTVIPVLFPFLLASNLFSALDLASGKWYAVLLGFLCGYPMGAKAACDLVKKDAVTVKQGQWLMCCCNLPSPMFLSDFVQIPAVTLAVYLPALLLLLPVFFFPNVVKPPVRTEEPLRIQPLLEQAMEISVKLMIKIGIYIMIFSILSICIQQFTFFSPFVRVLLLGLNEMTIGISTAKSMGFSMRAQAILCAVFCTFGGLSGLSQTKSVTEDAGFSMIFYLGIRLLHVLASVSILLLWHF